MNRSSSSKNESEMDVEGSASSNQVEDANRQRSQTPKASPGPKQRSSQESRRSSFGYANSIPFSSSLRDNERHQLGRSFIHGSYYNTQYHQPSPEVRNHWPSYDSEAVRQQTEELANIAISDDSYKPQNSKDKKSSQSDNDTGSGARNHETSFSTSPIKEVSEPSSPENLPIASSSILTRLIRTSPPEVLEDNSEDTQGDSSTKRTKAIRVASQHMDEQEPLLARRKSKGRDNNGSYQSIDDEDAEAQSELPSWRKSSTGQSSNWRGNVIGLGKRIVSPKSWDKKHIWKQGVVEPATHIPAVILGVLLNVLDGLSYGMILFPLGEPIFSALGPDGLSMFYVSCIISQLVYSCGGSVFKGGIGSEMIEVVPFFHSMAYTIMQEVGRDNPKAVVATTILSFAVSSIITGGVFFALGYLRLGSLIGFFPRHILVGCIGGVGWFLVATGLEVSARLAGSLVYNLDTLKTLFQVDTLPLWTVPLALALILMVLQHFIKHPLLVPLYFMGVPAIFYIVVSAVPALHLDDLRHSGWVFAQPASGVPFWHFYTLYDFKATDWSALASTIPAMFALTFFGVLHVPINVPALGVSTGVDDVDVNRELIAHGVSNALSGMCGSIQNYLVYTNSILFIRSGGDSRLAGIMLAFATIGIWMIGPVIIGFIPVMVVAALIFLLGFELLREALYDTWGKLHMFEYLTIAVIVVTMGAYDFVAGILVGILLACVTFVVQTSRKSPIRATYTGEVARSTVRRHPFQQRFLKQVGPQIFVFKLAGFMFFGTIADVERRIKDLLHEQNFSQRPIRFLIVDLTYVRGLDFSAAEAFTRLQRLMVKKNVNLVLSGVDWNGDVGKGLKGVGIWGDDDQVHVFVDLNSALEWCENEFLRAYYTQREESRPSHLDVPQNRISQPGDDNLASSPRRSQLHQAARSTLKETDTYQSKWKNFKQPLPLILQTFQERTSKNEDFWYKAVPFFKRKEFKAGTMLYKRGDDATEFYLIQEGILRAEYDLEQGQYYESIVAGTTCGELPFFSETSRTANVQAERDSIAWALDEESWERLQETQPEVAKELLRIALKLTTERVEAVTSYVLTRGA